jgi:hypothetical protein
MRKRLVLGWILAIGCGLAGAAPVAATPFAFDVLLTSDQVYPTDTGSSAAGLATLRYDPDTDLLSANVLVVGVSRADLIDVGPGLGPIHLHGGAPDQNGGVLVSLGNIGDWQDVVIDGDVLGISLSTGDLDVTGVANLEALLIQTEGSKTYLNLHTQQFGGGEIRGNVPPVPEPGTALMLGLGLAGLARAGSRAR